MRREALRRLACLCLSVAAWAGVAPPVHAQPAQAAAPAAVDALREQRDLVWQWQREALRPAELPPAAAAAPWQPPLAGESPCVTLREVSIALDGDALALGLPPVPTALQTPPADFIGACVGTVGLQRLQANLTRRLHALGYITSALTLPPQDLADGLLRFALHWGLLGQVQVQAEGVPGVRASTWASLPAFNAIALQRGLPLNLRDIEHTLENLARLPSQAARFVIEPGEQPQHSDLRIVVGTQPAWRAQVGIDALEMVPGRTRDLQVHTWVDAPLGWSDQLVVAASLSPDGVGPGQARRHSLLLQWSVPIARHLLSLSASSARNSRSLAGGVGRFSERGSDDQVSLRWQWTGWRGATWRSQVWAQWTERRSRSRIDDLELLGRRRVASELGIGAGHWLRLPCGEASVELETVHTVRMARLADFQDLAAPQPRQWRVQVDGQCRWMVAGADWTASVSAWTQAAERPFDGTDLLTLGGRNTVRGHTTVQALQGRRISVVRVGLAAPGQHLGGALAWQPWLGWDAGRVDQPASEAAVDSRRSRQAALLGLRWQAGWASGDLNWARAVGSSPVLRHGQWQAQVHWRF